MIPLPLSPASMLAIAAGVVIAVLCTTTAWYRGQAISAQAERDQARAQVQVLAGSLSSCNAAADAAREAGEKAQAATGELLAAARRLARPAEKTVERIETVIERGTPPGAGCEQAWRVIEDDRKASRGAP